MRKVVFAFSILVFSFSSLSSIQAQNKPGLVRRVVNSILFDTVASEKPKFIAYPTVAYAPETKWEFGISALYVYYAERDTANRLSEINAFTFFTLEQQFGLWLDHALYSDESKWFFLGKARIQRFPLIYYGIGPDVTGEELAVVNANSIAIRERVLRQIKDGFYIGLESDLTKLSKVSFDAADPAQFEEPVGARSYTNIGLGLGLVYDDRHNVLNVRKGFFGETGFLRYTDAWGSDFNFTSYFLDARYYVPVTKNQVFASQLFYNAVDGNAPFNQLALMGGESMMRGYYTGRYRDNAYLAAQAEYRFLPFSFSERWGAAAFASVGTVAEDTRSLDLSKLKVSGGAGVRFLLFKNKDIFTRFDVAFSEDGPGFYFFIGEAF